MQTQAKLCHKIPPTFAGQRALSDVAEAGQVPNIQQTGFTRCRKKGVVLDPLTVETLAGEADFLFTWKAG